MIVLPREPSREPVEMAGVESGIRATVVRIAFSSKLQGRLRQVY